MRLLLDSSGPFLLVALARPLAPAVPAAAAEQWELIAEVREPGRPPEGRDIGTVVAGLLSQAKAAASSGEPAADASAAAVSSVVVGLGPGSFIGTRVAISYANGLAAAAPQLRLYGVASLAAVSLAHAGLPVLRDARRGQWYLYLPPESTPDNALADGETRVLHLTELLDRLRQGGHRELVLEQPGPPRAPERSRPRQTARPDPFAELQEAAQAAAIHLRPSCGVSAAGLLLAAVAASPADYVEPIYLRGYL